VRTVFFSTSLDIAAAILEVSVHTFEILGRIKGCFFKVV